MPVKVIENIKPLSLPNFPVLSSLKTSRVITKHFTNLYLYQPPEHTTLLAWLVYQVAADNTFKYDSELLTQYSFTITAAKEFYKGTRGNTDIKAIRALFKDLIEQGYILPTNEGAVFMLSPMLSYRADYVSKGEYKGVMATYSNLVLPHHTEMFVNNYRELINNKIKAKKK